MFIDVIPTYMFISCMLGALSDQRTLNLLKLEVQFWATMWVIQIEQPLLLPAEPFFHP